jgi:2-haloacid dehalogenase
MNTHHKKVLFFDVNETLLDLTGVRRSVAQALNGGDEVVSLWFEMMLHYSLVANASDEYHNFGDIGAAVLQMLAQQRDIAMNVASAREVLQPIRTTPPHPEVPEALEKLKAHGYRLAALTNSPRSGMEQQLQNSGISKYFKRQFSVEDIGLYKPDHHVYRWAAHQMQMTPEECLFIAAHGWDVAGAMSAGMKAAFLNRPGQQLYPLAPEPDYIEPDLATLASKLVTNQ